MFVLCTIRYAAPVKFTLFVSLYRIVLAKLAHKICAVHALASLHFREAPFRAANTARRSLANPLKFKRLARVKFVNLVLSKLPFQLGSVGTGSVCVVAGFGKRRGCTCRCRVRAPADNAAEPFSKLDFIIRFMPGLLTVCQIIRLYPKHS